MQRMNLATKKLINLKEIWGPWRSITLDLSKQQLYWVARGDGEIFSSDYNGNGMKNSSAQISGQVLSISGSYLYTIDESERNIIVMNKTDRSESRRFTIEKSFYFKLMIFNNSDVYKGLSNRNKIEDFESTCY